MGKILLLHDFRLYEDRESVKKMVTPRSHDCMPVETEFPGRFELAQEDVKRRESMSQADHAHVEECTQSCLEHKTDRRNSKAN